MDDQGFEFVAHDQDGYRLIRTVLPATATTQSLSVVIDRYLAMWDTDLPIYIVNDAHQPVPVDLTARLSGPGGVELAKVERSLTLPSDCMTMEIERLRLTPDRPGDYRLALSLHSTEQKLIEHEYAIVVK